MKKLYVYSFWQLADVDIQDPLLYPAMITFWALTELNINHHLAIENLYFRGYFKLFAKIYTRY